MIVSDLYISAKSIKAGGSINAGIFIETRKIEAGGHIKTDGFIEAEEIKALKSIQCGSFIHCEMIETGEGYKVFAGLNSKEDETKDQLIIAKEIRGKIGHGIQL